MTQPAKLLYLGLPLGALALLSDGHDIAVACISRTLSPGMRRLRRLMAKRKRLLLGRPDLSDAGVRELIASEKPTLIVSWFWTRKIPAEVLALTPHSFGVHPSLLPRHRGPDPYFWTLAMGDEEAGVTAHTLSVEYDTGEVLSQVGLEVPEGCNAWQLARALDRPSLALLRETTTRFTSGDIPGSAPQDDDLATEAPFPDDEDCELRWEQSVEEALARIRAAAPDPGAFTGFGDDTIVILKARRADNVPAVLEPGDVGCTSEGVVVRAADGGVLLLEARREGDEHTLEGARIAELFPGIVRL